MQSPRRGHQSHGVQDHCVQPLPGLPGSTFPAGHSGTAAEGTQVTKARPLPGSCNGRGKIEGKIWCGDFFAEGAEYPVDADLVIGNPPWGSTAVEGTPAAKWCANPDHQYPIPDKQISAAFVWKAAHHVADSGRICLVLPHGTIFNHSTTALEFQRSFFKRHAVDHVLNLVDYQFFLFEEARHPAIVMTYRKEAPENRQHAIEYWGPKTDWLVTRAEVIAVMPEDRCTLRLERCSMILKGRTHLKSGSSVTGQRREIGG